MRVVLRKTGRFRPRLRFWGVLCLSLFTVFVIIGASFYIYFSVRFSKMIDERLQGSVFPNLSQIFAAPVTLRIGQTASINGLLSDLQAAGYHEKSDNGSGTYEMLSDGVRVVPGKNSFYSPIPTDIHLEDGAISSILSLTDYQPRTEYYLEPMLVTNLFDRTREKRRIVSYKELPKFLVEALLAIEDRRFFQHSGVDYLRMMKVLYVDLRSRRVQQGGSTLTMQLARSLFLTQDRTIKRKVEEIFVAFQLERRLTKEEILEYYCNKVYLGQRGGFSISGFGEAAKSYFNKDIRNITLPEAAFLAGIPQAPNLYSQTRNHESALRRRNNVLAAMVDTKAITEKERAAAVMVPLELTPSNDIANEAPYFVDMVKDRLLQKFTDEDLISDSFKVYTTLDLRLQRAAADAMRIGMAEVDQRLEPYNKARRKAKNAPASESDGQEQAEAAMVVLDPHTGAVKALIGGRDYGRSQLNRVLARRQPGSSFKPFVYATALSSVLENPSISPVTVVTRLNDVPTTFYFDGKEYKPANFKNEYMGDVSLRYAISHSLNVATIKVAETAGYDSIVALARKAGLNLQIQPTPAIALGAYEVKPYEIAGAYTIFANQGVHMEPFMVSTVKDSSGDVIDSTKSSATAVLDPRVAFLMTSLMGSVIESGTGNGVRTRGFTAPASGKTGTSHDGWFAGYTSNLLCIVWVGYDSNKELPLSGAFSALPIWTEFMKRAKAIPEFSNMSAPVEPEGIASVQIDPDSGGLATANCPRTQTEYFIEGTQPSAYCPIHSMRQLPRTPGLEHISGTTPVVVAPPVVPVVVPPVVTTIPSPPPTVVQTPIPLPPKQTPEPPKKKGFFGRVIGIIKGEPQFEEEQKH